MLPNIIDNPAITVFNDFLRENTLFGRKISLDKKTFSEKKTFVTICHKIQNHSLDNIFSKTIFFRFFESSKRVVLFKRSFFPVRKCLKWFEFLP